MTHLPNTLSANGAASGFPVETLPAQTAAIEPALPIQHPLVSGQVFFSPGCHFSYRVIGACCRLFDREQLPWPCCRLQWRGKEPSWRRIGKRFVVDLATRGHPTYSVEILGQGPIEPVVITLYSVTLPTALNEWWYLDRPDSRSDSRPASQ